MFSKQLISSLALIGSSLADEIMMNLIPGLVPPEGAIWRGATISSDGPLEGSWTYGTDPEVFEAYYNQPLHIYRSFNNLSNADLTYEKDWIREKGGILWYSLQPKDWVAYGDGSKDDEIRMYAQILAEMKPHQIMMPIGYEPDLYVDVATEDDPDKRRGTAEDYKNMIRRFDTLFKEEEATNVIWVMDYSWNIRDTPDLAVELWPQDVEIGWLFFNMFQFVKIAASNGKGDCLGGF